MNTTEIKDLVGANNDAPVSPVTPTGRERAQARWVTVEPIIAMAMLGVTVLNLIRPLFLEERVREWFNVTDINNNTECVSSNTTGNSLNNKVQSEVSLWQLYLLGASGFVSIISTAFLGTMSDKLGRKLCMALPIVGFIIQEVLYGVTIHFHLPLYSLLAAEIIQGLSGGFGLLISGCMSYLSDATSVEQRTFRIVVAEMLTYFVGGLSLIGEGYLIRYYDYIPPLCIAFGVNVLVLFYIAVPPFLIETVDRRDPAYVREFRETGRSMVKLFKFNENGRRWQMILLDFMIFASLMTALGTAAILVLYGIALPFCWSADTAGIASATSLLTMSIGMVIGTKLFSMCLGDYWLMQISCLSMSISYIGLGLARSTWVIFIAIGLGSLRGIAIPVARSVLSKITSQDEIGAMFAVVGCLESLSMFLSFQVASGLYAASVSILPALTFYVYAGLCLIPACTILALQIFWPRKNEYRPLGVDINGE